MQLLQITSCDRAIKIRIMRALEPYCSEKGKRICQWVMGNTSEKYDLTEQIGKELADMNIDPADMTDELLADMTAILIENQYDVRQMMSLLCLAIGRENVFKAMTKMED